MPSSSSVAQTCAGAASQNRSLCSTAKISARSTVDSADGCGRSTCATGTGRCGCGALPVPAVVRRPWTTGGGAGRDSPDQRRHLKDRIVGHLLDRGSELGQDRLGCHDTNMGHLDVRLSSGPSLRGTHHPALTQ